MAHWVAPFRRDLLNADARAVGFTAAIVCVLAACSSTDDSRPNAPDASGDTVIQGAGGSPDAGTRMDAAAAGGSTARDGAATLDASGGSASDAAMSATSDAAMPTSSDAAMSATGCIVPLYTDPGDASWNAIIAAQNAHSTVPVIAIVNPNNGPGSAPSAAYTTGIAALTAARIRVIGYVYTSYGARSTSAVRGDVDDWHAWYPEVGGIFFDEESNDAGGDGYYRDLTSYVKSLGMQLTVGNPGTDTSASYISAVDVTFIYESAGLPSTPLLSDWQSQYPRQSVGIIPYASPLDLAWVSRARAAVGYIYVTDDDLPNPWDTLPAFFDELLGALG